MNIGFDGKRAFRNATGLGNYSRLVIDSLLKFEPEHRYIVFGTPGRSWTGGVVQKPSGPLALVPALWRSFGIPQNYKKLELGIFHGLSSELPLVRKSSRVKRVVTVADLIFLRYPQFFSAIDRTTYTWKTKHACKNADVTIAVSQQTKEDIIEWFGIPEDRIQVLNPTFDPCFISPKKPVPSHYGLSERYLLTVGTIEERKNLLVSVQALEHVKDISLVVVGKKKQPYAGIVESYARARGLHHRIHFLENVPTEDLPSLYQNAEIFLYPSVFEGFGMPVLEALVCGTPVITSHGSSLSEPGGPSSCYVNPLVPEELAENIEALLRSPERRRQMRDAGKAYAYTKRPEAMAQALIQIYKNL